MSFRCGILAPLSGRPSGVSQGKMLSNPFVGALLYGAPGLNSITSLRKMVRLFQTIDWSRNPFLPGLDLQS